MRVLIVSNEYQSEKRKGNPVIDRILSATQKDNRVECVSFCPFENKFRNFWEIRQSAKMNSVIHVHFGGIYALLIWIVLIGIKIPKLLTFHGTDIHGKEALTTKSLFTKCRIRLNQLSSYLSFFLYDKIGVVSNTLLLYVPCFVYKLNRKKVFIQPLGVDYNIFRLISKPEALEKLGIEDYHYVLFSDKTNTPLKRRDIAEEILNNLPGYKLLPMCNVNPQLVPYYINASEFTLLTSDEEGSPNIVRETLSLNKRVFSVNVGDVKSQLEGLNDSCIISRNPKEAAFTIQTYLKSPYTDNTREKLKNKLDFSIIIGDIIDIYVSFTK